MPVDTPQQPDDAAGAHVDTRKLAAQEVDVLTVALFECEVCVTECGKCEGEGETTCTCECGHEHDADCPDCGGDGFTAARDRCDDCREAKRRIVALTNLYGLHPTTPAKVARRQPMPSPG